MKYSFNIYILRWWELVQKSSSNKELFKRLTVRIILAAVLVIVILYLLPRFIHLLFPIILAYLLAALINPLVNKINFWFKKTKIRSSFSRNMITLFLTSFILVVISVFIYLVFATLIQEVVGLATSIQENWQNIVTFFEDLENWVAMQVIVLPGPAVEILENFTESILNFIQNFSSNLLSITVSSTGWLISRMGSFSLNFITFFLALYFIMSDFNVILGHAIQRTDQRLLDSIRLLKNSALIGVIGYVKTQVILAGVAFIFMFTAFTLYGQPYNFIIALALAIVDLIPLIGTIAVLAPWGVIEIIGGDPNKGVFLIFLGILFFVFRRLTEPKIMGTQTGLHPLLALIGIYVGIQFSGLWGALLGPLVMILIISVIRSGVLDNTFRDFKEVYYKTAILLKRD